MNDYQTTDQRSAQGRSQLHIGEPSALQMPLLPFDQFIDDTLPYRERLVHLLSSDLDFHSYDTSYASHDFHAFPAKFPPQLPEKFILGLTCKDEVVLDPMMGSGTTIVEAVLNDRQAVGFDIDPLARLITRVKTTPLDLDLVYESGQAVTRAAMRSASEHRDRLIEQLSVQWDPKTKKFIDYWFARETQIELIALRNEICKIRDESIRAFLELVFSACIITKSGGVSLAFDLAHTRPHRAKVVRSNGGQIIIGEELVGSDNSRVLLLSKTLKPAFQEFQKRFSQNLASLADMKWSLRPPMLYEGDAQHLTIPDSSIDLIVTSPPYASNAIDYMRAHKFSLVWLGYAIDNLGIARSDYIGGEATMDYSFEELPPHTVALIEAFEELDPKKSKVLRRYYSEMKRVLAELYRVLRPGKALVLVVASSVMRGKDTETDQCLAEIGKSIGFEVPKIGVRTLDRNKRMMPAGMKIDQSSQIQQRMHEEYVIGFYKPEQTR